MQTSMIVTRSGLPRRALGARSSSFGFGGPWGRRHPDIRCFAEVARDPVRGQGEPRRRGSRVNSAGYGALATRRSFLGRYGQNCSFSANNSSVLSETSTIFARVSAQIRQLSDDSEAAGGSDLRWGSPDKGPWDQNTRRADFLESSC